MASPEDDAETRIETLTDADLPQAIALSGSANWNQNDADWRTLLTLGRGFGIRASDESLGRRLVASALVLPYCKAFGWISMVLVLPAFRRRGHATRLLRHCVQHLRATGRVAVLDATPAGRAVYSQQGFVAAWGFSRYRREAGAAAVGEPVDDATRRLHATDWPLIEALDTPAFGADRTALLRTLATRWPEAARVVEQEGRLRGVVLGRDGREAHQIGPLLADDAGVAQTLIASVLSRARRPIYLDLLDDRSHALGPWLQQQGFAVQRPFMRMVNGASRAPGDPARIWVVAGPELG
jgi:ribosomal protein S18 acetylase RimI-like enzyme